MIRLKGGARRRAERAKLAALDRSLGVVEFDPDGNILTANDNFLKLTGYALAEIKGRHHRLFVAPEERDGAAYAAFWDSLRRGEYQSAEYRRLTKAGQTIWIRATYNPVIGRGGRPVSIVKYAIDITAQKRHDADVAGQTAAINQSQAVIEFDLDGNILTANQNFLDAMGYALEEIRGRHHGMFVTPAERDGAAYRAFWAALRRGEHQTAEYKRLGKGGREVWIHATYTPVRDLDGVLCKVVKYATDISARKRHDADLAGQVAAIGRAQAVIEFDLTGRILGANENMLRTMGYTLAEIQGRHHSMFVDPAEARGPDYEAFWEKLRRGEYHASTYRRIGRDGRTVWLQATYNPILDLDDRPYKVVKYATDITQRVTSQRRAIASAEHVFGNVNAIASAVQQMTASVEEISSNMTRSEAFVDGIHRQISGADKTTLRLSDAAQAMTGVTQLIQQIASQTTLLSLNATIESARAGEAGRGFAVVASEVKSLAQQTATAIERIAREIQSVQTASGEVIAIFGEIAQAIGTVRESVGSVAGAVVEQSAVIRTIAEKMQSAAAEASEITMSFDDEGTRAAA
ncbi:methyl-accepting chemotaxis protein [Acidisphaera rubrifaciens]|uniref:Methyl-accepting chemotaxis sensory transducer n=1 Tax=Acidisphaera rubrifaciens HS-AP3 TaxID=1231350 RepID=A0A0D6P5B6_9PROT|nr:PAS domain-containing methyl-accepting chemotaxis protein [Acidisphaera rubrifaciens]GAN76079.1 methyl-accepting chemotaxis sensory transducer [Acidisphaera rubrifaciens HS-AP3]